MKYRREKWLKAFLIATVGISLHMLLYDIVQAETPETLTNKKSDIIPFYWVVGIVGGCIALTLFYVGWRKYKGEEKEEKKDQEDSGGN
ncbi:MAG TPA: sporulation protein YpjB [Bacillota bacterium]|nr:sporulation protein YpjB [Bacillota bacterium]